MAPGEIASTGPRVQPAELQARQYIEENIDKIPLQRGRGFNPRSCDTVEILVGGVLVLQRGRGLNPRSCIVNEPSHYWLKWASTGPRVQPAELRLLRRQCTEEYKVPSTGPRVQPAELLYLLCHHWLTEEVSTGPRVQPAELP